MSTELPSPTTQEQGGAANNALVLMALALLVGAAIFTPRCGNGSTVDIAEGHQAGSAQTDLDSEASPSRPDQPAPGKTPPGSVVQAEVVGASPGKTPTVPAPMTPSERQAMAWEDTLRSPGAKTGAKLAALAELRKRDRTGEEFAPVMIEMLSQSRDEALALGVIREMGKRENHLFGQALLDVVMGPASQRTKIAAVRTLGGYLGEPSVLSMLSQTEERATAELAAEIREVLEARAAQGAKPKGRSK